MGAASFAVVANGARGGRMKGPTLRKRAWGTRKRVTAIQENGAPGGQRALLQRVALSAGVAGGLRERRPKSV